MILHVKNNENLLFCNEISDSECDGEIISDLIDISIDIVNDCYSCFTNIVREIDSRCKFNWFELKRVQDSWIQTTNEEYGIDYMWVTHNDSTPPNRHKPWVLWK